MNKPKMTYAIALDAAIAVVTNKEVKDKLKALKASLAKKSAAERKPTPNQVENAAIARKVVALTKGEPARLFSITELMKNVPGLPEDFKSQRMTAILRTLLPTVGTGEILRVEDKRKVFFKYNPDYVPSAAETEDSSGTEAEAEDFDA